MKGTAVNLVKGVIDMNNITLIGMPGVGKSTIGRLLGEKLGYQFIDSDHLIEKIEGRPLSRIIDEEGDDGFLEIENKVNSEIEVKNTVIATGGSAVYGTEAMEHFKEIGIVVYLYCSFEILDRRLSDLHARGVVLRPGQTLYDLFVERTVLYDKYADIVVNADGVEVDETIDYLMSSLSKMKF